MTVLFVTHDVAEAVYLGDVVFVMSGRPGRITHALDVHLARGDLSEDLRSTPEFVRLRHEIWQLTHQRRATSRLAVAHAA